MIDALVEKSINILIDKSVPITSKEIADNVGVSSSTVKHNIGYIKSVIANCGGKLISIPGKGFLLQMDNNQRKELKRILNENKDYSFYFSYRKNYILDILFHNKSNYTLQLFADDLGVGRNIINKDLDEIEKWLFLFDLKIIKTRNKGISIYGGEFEIRQAIIYNNINRVENMLERYEKPEEIDYRISQSFYNYFKSIYGKYDLFALQEYLREIEMDLDTNFDENSFTQLLEYIAVSFDRIKGNNIIKDASVLKRCKIKQEQYDVSKKLIEAVSKGELSYLTAEIHCLAAQIAICGAYDSNQSVIKEAYYNGITERYLSKINDILTEKKLLYNQSLVEDISLFLIRKKTQKSYRYFSSPFFRKDIKEQLPSLYAIIMTSVQPLENTLNVKFTENDIAYLCMLIDNAIDEEIKELKVMLYTSSDRNTAKYLSNKIIKGIKNINKIYIARQENINELNLDEYDLILTMTRCDFNNAVKISRRIDDNDLRVINNHVKRLLNNKTEAQYNYQMFNEDLIYVNFKSKNKNECIHKCYEMLKDNNYVVKGFEDVILEREYITSTAIGNYIAIPHCYKNFVKKSGVSILTLDKPIDWSEDDKVQIIFMLAIEFNEQEPIASFFKKFYELIKNNEIIEKIISSKNSKEIYALVREMGIVNK